MNKSVYDIINALGGTGNLANLLGVKPSAVSNYRKKGFPARLHLKIISLCEEYSIPTVSYTHLTLPPIYSV